MVARGAVSAANRRRRLALRAAQMYPIFRLHRSNHAEVARSICTTRCADAIQRRSTTSATRSASAIPPSFATCIRAPPGRPGNRARIVLLAPDVAVPGDQTAPGHRRARQPGRLAAAAEEGSSPRQHSPGSAAVHDSGGMPDPAQAAADIVPHRNPSPELVVRIQRSPAESRLRTRLLQRRARAARPLRSLHFCACANCAMNCMAD